MLSETHRFGIGRRRWDRYEWLWLAGLALYGCVLEIFGRLLECLHLLVPNNGIEESWCLVLESVDDLGGGDCCILCRGSEMHCGIMWKEFYCISVDN